MGVDLRIDEVQHPNVSEPEGPIAADRREDQDLARHLEAVYLSADASLSHHAQRDAACREQMAQRKTAAWLDSLKDEDREAYEAYRRSSRREPKIQSQDPISTPMTD